MPLAESQLAELRVLREHRGAFTAQDSLELGRSVAADELEVLV